MSVRRVRCTSRLVRGLLGVAFAASLVAAGPLTASADGPDDLIVTVPEASANPPDGGQGIIDAQLRWGVNAESGGGAFAGVCNFLSAGRAGNSGGARVWGAGDGLYSAQQGNVSIEKPTAAGTWEAVSWQTKCLDPNGATVSTSSTASTTGNQVVIDGGTGSLIGGALDIRWSGSFTVAFYGGMTYWSVTDPVLTLDADGNGRLVATASGYGTSMEDMTQWLPLADQAIVLAEIRGVDTATDAGFATLPAYVGVMATGAGQAERTAANSAYWGSFPQSFVDFHRATGQQGYWLTTGGVRDAAKPAAEIYVSYDAAAPVAVAAPPAVAGTAVASPPIPLTAAGPAAAVAALPGLSANVPLTTLPQRAALVPGASTAVPAIVPPLLASAAALSVAIVSVLSMMRRLPWQVARVPTPAHSSEP